jgi:hypothetical protein
MLYHHQCHDGGVVFGFVVPCVSGTPTSPTPLYYDGAAISRTAWSSSSLRRLLILYSASMAFSPSGATPPRGTHAPPPPGSKTSWCAVQVHGPTLVRPYSHRCGRLSLASCALLALRPAARGDSAHLDRSAAAATIIGCGRGDGCGAGQKLCITAVSGAVMGPQTTGSSYAPVRLAIPAPSQMTGRHFEILIRHLRHLTCAHTEGSLMHGGPYPIPRHTVLLTSRLLLGPRQRQPPPRPYDSCRKCLLPLVFCACRLPLARRQSTSMERRAAQKATGPDKPGCMSARTLYKRVQESRSPLALCGGHAPAVASLALRAHPGR